MKHLFLNKELSLLAKEKGFDDPCLAYWTPLKNWMKGDTSLAKSFQRDSQDGFYFHWVPNHFGDRDSTVKNSKFTIELRKITAPLYQQIIDWFEEKHDIIILLRYTVGVNEWTYWIKTPDNRILTCDYLELEAYEDKYKSLNKAIEEAFKLI